MLLLEAEDLKSNSLNLWRCKMTKEWPKELPPFDEMREIFIRGAFDTDGDIYYDPKSGKKFYVNIFAGTAVEV